MKKHFSEWPFGLVCKGSALSERTGTVFIVEDVDPRDIHPLTGRFSARWESPDGDRFRRGPEGGGVEDAIDWGRAQADVVLVRPLDSATSYSAGARRPQSELEAGERFPVWPEGRSVRRRRPAGMQHLDPVAEKPIPWQVRLPWSLPESERQRYVDRLEEALSSQPVVEAVRIDAWGGGVMRPSGPDDRDAGRRAREQDVLRELADVMGGGAKPSATGRPPS